MLVDRYYGNYVNSQTKVLNKQAVASGSKYEHQQKYKYCHLHLYVITHIISTIIIYAIVMGGYKFPVCLSVCSRCISSENKEQIWLKFCKRMEVCPGHCISH